MNTVNAIYEQIYLFESTTYPLNKEEIGVVVNTQFLNKLKAEMSKQIEGVFYNQEMQDIKIMGYTLFPSNLMPYNNCMIGYIKPLTDKNKEE